MIHQPQSRQLSKGSWVIPSSSSFLSSIRAITAPGGSSNSSSRGDLALKKTCGVGVILTFFGEYVRPRVCRTYGPLLSSIRHAQNQNSDRKSTRLNSSHGYISY